MVACPHSHVMAEHNQNGFHTCLDCHADVPCAAVGPDVCDYEAVRADRTDQVVIWLVERARLLGRARKHAQAAALREAAADLERGAAPDGTIGEAPEPPAEKPGVRPGLVQKLKSRDDDGDDHG